MENTGGIRNEDATIKIDKLRKICHFELVVQR